MNGYLEFWPNILLMVVLYGIGGYLLFLSFKFNDASTATILASTQIIWSIFAGIFLLGDNLGLYQIIGVVLVIIAVIIINLQFDKSSKINSKGLIYGLIAAACFGVAFINDNYIIGDKNIPSYLAISFLLPALIQIFFLKKPILKLKLAAFGNNSIKLFSLSLIYAISTILLFMARQVGGTAAIVNTIQQTSIVLTVILAAIFLKEKENLPRKLIASLLCVIAVVLFAIV